MLDVLPQPSVVGGPALVNGGYVFFLLALNGHFLAELYCGVTSGQKVAVEEKESGDDTRKHDVQQPRDNNDNVDPGEDVPRSLEETAHHDHSEHDQSTGSIEEQQEKVLVVHISNAVTDPGAMVVHLEDAATIAH